MNISLSAGDRLLLMNQFKILQFLNRDRTEEYDNYIYILANGYQIYYEEILGGLEDEVGEKDKKVQLVLNILSMYRMIEDYKTRHPEDVDITNHHYGVFQGFDGNNEGFHYSFARFVIYKLGRFDEQLRYGDQRELNSHSPMVQQYEKMINKWQGLSNHNKQWNEFSHDEILSILEM
jgi:uncharacterized protein